MPVILTGQQCDLRLEGEAVDALALQQPLPAATLKIVATGSKQDTPA
jgi:hypothetical protein